MSKAPITQPSLSTSSLTRNSVLWWRSRMTANDTMLMLMIPTMINNNSSSHSNHWNPSFYRSPEEIRTNLIQILDQALMIADEYLLETSEYNADSDWKESNHDNEDDNESS